jgi:hypothetical protein
MSKTLRIIKNPIKLVISHLEKYTGRNLQHSSTKLNIRVAALSHE